MAAGVVIYWRKSALDALAGRVSWDSEQWFIVGVFIGFIGQLLDNAYWLIPWGLSYVGSDMAPWFFDHGPIFNIFSRQILGIVSAYCHIRAAVIYSRRGSTKLGRLAVFAFVAGFCYSLLLILSL